MKYLPLVWAGLSRSRFRTLLTFLTVVASFLLFAVLHGVSGGFDELVNAQSDTRLQVQSRVSYTQWIPLAMRSHLERVPGVTGVAVTAYFGGYYQDPKNQLGATARDVAEMFKLYPELELPASERDAMLHTPTGLLVGADVARRYGWKIGDRVAIGTPIWQHPDGTRDWNFTIVGIYRYQNSALTADGVWMNFKYFDDARTGLPGLVASYIVGIKDPASAEHICDEIDAFYGNSATPTLTQTEKSWMQAQIRSLGNIEFMVDAIVGAVLFTLIALTANTMMQSIRERTAELGVLKTIGYSTGVISALVVLEALLLCVSAALCGIGIAALVFPKVIAYFGIGAIPIPMSVVGTGLLIAVCLAFVSAALPLWRASRLQVTEALATRQA
ncbi:MAG: FtsX-like permease family protein [Steroidobacteraceae bacterium]